MAKKNRRWLVSILFKIAYQIDNRPTSLIRTDPFGVRQQKMRLLLKLIFLNLLLASCSKHNAETPYELNRSMTVISNLGHEAYIVEATLVESSYTQVIVNFAGGKCGAGAVNSVGTELNLHIEWKEGEILIVSKPIEINLTRNASGEILQCGDQKVKVVIKNHVPSKND